MHRQILNVHERERDEEVERGDERCIRGNSRVTTGNWHKAIVFSTLMRLAE